MPNVPQLPKVLSQATGVLPLWPLEFTLSRLAAGIARGRPALLDRLGPYADKTIAVAPNDVKAVFLVKLGPGQPAVTAVRDAAPSNYDARISGPLLALVDLAEGRMDGDALFFSREITIDGDMEAVVALRNALDAESLDLIKEAFRPLGPLGASMSRIGRSALNLMRASLLGPAADRNS